jgi:hypothetical protein
MNSANACPQPQLRIDRQTESLFLSHHEAADRLSGLAQVEGEATYGSVNGAESFKKPVARVRLAALAFAAQGRGLPW